MKKLTQGFTLIEMIITVSILLALGVFGVAGMSAAKRKAQCVVEINAARNLITGYLSHAAENNGRVLAGYQTAADTSNIEGEPLHYPMNARYPWRLAPHVPKIEGVLLFNGNESALASGNRDYLVSVHPNLGINATLVGGHFGTGSPLPPTPKMIDAFGKFHLTHLTDSNEPGKLIVFGSARSSEGEQGYFEIRPPNLLRPLWSGARFSKSAAPQQYGFVDFRWDGKSVCAMLGGNVELLGEKELRDMRRWSIQAERANEADFLIKPQVN